MVLSSSVLKGTPGIAVGSLRKVCTGSVSAKCIRFKQARLANLAAHKQRLVRNVTFMYMFHLKPAVKKQL